MRVDLLDHLLQRRLGRPRHVVEEDVLRRVRDVDRAIRLIERVLAGGEDGQRLAVRTEARAHRHAGDEIRVGRQPRVQIRLHRIVDRGGRDVVAAGQTGCPPEPAIVIAVVSALLVVPLAAVAAIALVAVDLAQRRRQRECEHARRAQDHQQREAKQESSGHRVHPPVAPERAGSRRRIEAAVERVEQVSDVLAVLCFQNGAAEALAGQRRHVAAVRRDEQVVGVSHRLSLRAHPDDGAHPLAGAHAAGGQLETACRGRHFGRGHSRKPHPRHLRLDEVGERQGDGLFNPGRCDR